MLNNKLIALVGGKPNHSRKRYVWTAYNSMQQGEYPFKGSIPDVGLALVSETRFNKEDLSKPLPPHLCFFLQPPALIDDLDPSKIRLDVMPVLSSDAPAMYIESNPSIQYPVNNGEYLSVTLEANFMILLPEAADKTESIQPIFKWQPEPSSYESIVTRYIRNDLGETSVDITHYKEDGSSTSTRFDFDQFSLNDPRLIFNMVVESDKITVTINGEYSGFLPYASNVKGKGYFTILYPETNEQGANIAEVYRVSLTRDYT